MIDVASIKARFEALEPILDERGRRLLAASEARAAGHGGVTAVSQATGIARSTIDRGLADLRSGAVMFSTRVRRQGGGGKPSIVTQPRLLETLNELKQGGRLVGIISHLEEVKQRIPDRLEVLPAPRGSRARFRFGG